MVQEQAMKVWKEEKDFKALLLGSEELMKILSPKEIDEIFDPKRSLKHIEYIFEHAGIR
jgi:adenylosuccinate lyase